MHQVAAVGDNVADIYPSLGCLFPGGNALNVAVAARRGGVEAAYVGAIGTDEAGQAVLQFAHLFANGQTALRKHGQARAVITAILQAPQGFQQDGRRCFLTDVSDDAAHDG